MRPLVVAAFGPELAGFEKSPVARATVGVGLTLAALGTSHLLHEQRPSRVICVGTAGAYPSSGLAIGDVIFATKVVLASSAVALGKGALVAGSAEPIELSGSMAEAKPAVVANTLAVTTDDALAGALERSTGAQVEHLEAYAVARACAQANVPLTIVVGIANIVGSQGREQWRKHHERISLIVGELVLRAI
jgi:futalosine hydrolase